MISAPLGNRVSYPYRYAEEGEGSLPEGGQREPEEEDELEGEVEGEPVDNADEALDDASREISKFIGQDIRFSERLT
jgi:hypothetical protein